MEFRNRGFTLLEIMLVIVLMALLVGISIPVYVSFQNQNDLDLAVQDLSSVLLKAQFLSQGVSQDSAWGVELEKAKFTIFKGNDFNSRSSEFDQVVEYPASVDVSGDKEIIFSSFYGKPLAPISVVLQLNNKIRNLSVNEKGVIDY